ncbi:uncharacterized protein J3D65DRAFT_612250 [Phyllosticta citribraziliensis]|uniref:DUF3253 domain-containing protein n=1 Tax=Phyllosticta citribraziliensis TaxID=989973 RepID=A0ABR1M6V7_9PEZI
MSSTLQSRLEHFLTHRAHPKTFCPSEVARALSSQDLTAEGAKEWRELMPRIRQILWEMRDRGEVEILQRGEVLGDHVGIDDVKGPIRARRISGHE